VQTRRYSDIAAAPPGGLRRRWPRRSCSGSTARRPDGTATWSSSTARSRDSAWKIISERLDVLTETCGALAQEPGLAALGDLAAKLRSITGGIRTHLGKRASPPSGRG
jgi:hypothetical protein